MHTLLVPVDGSIHSVKAVHIACDLCEKYGGKIALFHSLLRNKGAEDFLALKLAELLDKKTIVALKGLAALPSPRAVPNQLLFDIGFSLLDVSQEQVRRRGLKADKLEIGTGDAADDILTAVKLVSANTIVMGCRGVSESSPGHFGSVSQRIFAEAGCTCIAVK